MVLKMGKPYNTDQLVGIIERSAKMQEDLLETAENAAGIIFVEGVKALSRRYPRRKIVAQVGMGSLSVTVQRFGFGREYYVSGYEKHDDDVPGTEFLSQLIEMEDLFAPTYNNRPIVPDMYIELLAGEITEKRW